ncbi:MAG: DNA alkylation repair protein [Nanoarchaeota archaeon]|nr:DNA alkylation repair protein [Nanoarchaeota archaeon]
MLEQLKKDLNKLASPEKAKLYQRFFKTGKGEYGEGDKFIGLTMPEQRAIAKDYLNLSLPKIQELLKNKIHEYRMTGLVILVNKYKKANEKDREEIFNFYLNNAKNINNWDLVDVTCPKIMGNFLLDKNKKILYTLVHSENLWEKRIAIISTMAFIDNGEFEDTLAISELLLKDKHDLIHKAVGWMLREVGKKDESVLKKFLREHYKDLPRTTLRYSIERFPEKERKKWLKGEFK